MKNIFNMILITFLFFGCSQRLGDFTVMSTKNVDINANYVKVERNIKGKDMNTPFLSFFR